MMVIKSTAKIIRRKFIIFSGEKKQLKKQVIDPGPIFREDKIYNLLFLDGDFWPLKEMEKKKSEEVNKGTKMNKKSKIKTSKAVKDEERRRAEKEKTALQHKIDGLEMAFQSLQASCGQLQDKLRLNDEHIASQERYILDLELRISKCCPPCRKGIPDSVFIQPDDSVMTRLLHTMQNQAEAIRRIEENVIPGTGSGSGAPNRSTKGKL